MAVKDLPPGSDPANPPLTAESREASARLTDVLVRKYGPPAAIFQSPMTRCLDTAEYAARLYGQHYNSGVLVVTLNTLCQPDSGDVDPENPKARADGLVIYGQETYSPQWYEWFLTSRMIIRTIENQVINILGKRDDRPIFAFTHRPLVAAARWATRHNDGGFPGRDDIDALDKGLLPYCLFRDLQGPDQAWIELPRE